MRGGAGGGGSVTAAHWPSEPGPPAVARLSESCDGASLRAGHLLGGEPFALLLAPARVALTVFAAAVFAAFVCAFVCAFVFAALLLRMLRMLLLVERLLKLLLQLLLQMLAMLLLLLLLLLLLHSPLAMLLLHRLL